jgi:hypothetical protein
MPDAGFLLQSIVLGMPPEPPAIDGDIPGWSIGDPIPDPWLPACTGNGGPDIPVITVVAFPAPTIPGVAPYWNIGGCINGPTFPAFPLDIRFQYSAGDWAVVNGNGWEHRDEYQWTWSYSLPDTARGIITVYAYDFIRGLWSEPASWRTNDFVWP